MQSFRKRGSVKALQFNRKFYEEYMKGEGADVDKEVSSLLKRIKKTPQGYFCSSSSGLRPITDGSWVCIDQGRVFTMSDKDLKGKFEEITELGGAGSEQYDELALEYKELEKDHKISQDERETLTMQVNNLTEAHEQLILEHAKLVAPEPESDKDEDKIEEEAGVKTPPIGKYSDK